MSGTFKQKPQNAGDILGAIFREKRITTKVKDYSVFPMWGEVVGEAIAKVTKPEKIIKGNVLLVRVLDSVWSQELSLQKEDILEKLFEVDTGAHIQDIQFVTGDPKSISPKE